MSIFLNLKDKMAEIILKTEIPRETDYLYFCGTDNKGNIMVCKAKMARGGKHKVNKKGKGKRK